MDRDPIDPRIEYEGFQAPSPSIAWGQFLGHRWELYGRWDHYDFTLSTDPNVYPDGYNFRDLSPEDIPPEVFFVERQYGPIGKCSASYMTDEEKREAVRKCIALFEQRNLGSEI